MKAKKRTQIEKIIASGTPKAKAALVFEDYDRQQNGESALLSKADKAAINDSLSLKDTEEFNKWIQLCDFIYDQMPPIIMQTLEVRVFAHRLKEYINTWELYVREAKQLNALCIDMEEANVPEEAVKTLKENIRTMNFPFAKIKEHGDGLFEIDIDGEGNLYEIILSEAEELRKRLSYLKGMVNALEDFLKKKKATAFYPLQLKNNVNLAKMDYGEYIAPEYSKHRYNRYKAEGYELMPNDLKKAVYPDYDEIEPFDEYYNFIAKRLGNENK